jgi:hypothetical protein
LTRRPEVVAVSFVHGHPRAAGWVVAHVRRPNHPEAGQSAPRTYTGPDLFAILDGCGPAGLCDVGTGGY